MKTKKGLALAGGASAVLMLVVIGMVAVVGLKILTQINAGEASGSDVNLTVQNATLGIDQVVAQFGLIGLIVIMSIVITILWGSFGGMMRGGGV